jgi:hypothetical protein
MITPLLRFFLDGLPYTVVLWDDPNGHGVPNDANLRATASDVIVKQGH